MAQVLNGSVSAARIARLFASETPLPNGSRYRALARSLSTWVRDGRIPMHARMPAERELAAALSLSRTTVTAAYDLLRDEGFLVSRRGAGSWSALPADGSPSTLGGWLMPSPTVALDLSCATPLPDPALVESAFADTTSRLYGLVAGHRYEPFGLPELRAAIAARYTARGLPTTPEQILVTSGAQHALSLVTQLLCAPGDRVLVENPSYPNALQMLRRARTRLIGVPVDDTGWHVETVHALLRQSAPRMAYLIPDFQNPVGRLMAEEERAPIAEAARRAGTWLVVDETLTDIGLDVPTPTPFAATVPVARDDHLITIGSMSKSHWAGLRVGWVRAASRLITELAGVRVGNDIAGPTIEHALAARLLDRVELLDELRERLRHQRATLETALRERLPAWRWTTPPGGLSLWVDIGEPTAASLVERAATHGVRIAEGPRFGLDPGIHEHRLRIPYTLSAEQLRDAVARLDAALRGEPAQRAFPEQERWVA